MLHLSNEQGHFEPSLEQIAGLRSAAGGEHLRPVLEAATTGRIDLHLLAHPKAAWPSSALRKAPRPALVIIGDDPGGSNGFGGPAAWRCAAKISRWAPRACVHAAGSELGHYIGAVLGAIALRRLVLVETTSMHAAAWTRVVGPEKCLLVLPRDGQHPVSEVLH